MDETDKPVEQTTEQVVPSADGVDTQAAPTSEATATPVAEVAEEVAPVAVAPVAAAVVPVASVEPVVDNRPESVKSLPDSCPRVEIKLFVGRVPREYTDENLKPVFTAYGEVLESLIIKDKNSSQSKGSGFIRMKSLCDADNAIFQLHNKKVLSQDLGPMQVRYATGEPERLGMTEVTANPGGHEAKLFVGSLPRQVTEQEVRDIFAQFGTIHEVYLLRDNTTGEGKGCAFVKFDFKECAIWAISKFNGDYTFPGFNRPLEVRFAESKKTAAQGVVNMTPGTMMNGMQPSMAAPNLAPMGYPYQAYQSPQSQQMVYQQPGMYQQQGQQNTGGAGQASGQPVTSPPNNANPRSVGGWREYFTAEGRAYYHNEATNTTTWDVPREFERAPPPMMAQPMMAQPAAMANPGPTQVGPVGDVAGPPGANVFIFHVPNEWTTNELVQCFGPWGTIASARVAVDNMTQRNKGYAFVSYDNIQSAVNAVQNMNGYMAGTKRLKVSIKQGEEQYVQGIMGQVGTGAGGQTMGASRMGPY